MSLRASNQAKVMLRIATQRKGEGKLIPIHSILKAKLDGCMHNGWHVNLQRSVGEVRRLALQGCYDIDIRKLPLVTAFSNGKANRY